MFGCLLIRVVITLLDDYVVMFCWCSTLDYLIGNSNTMVLLLLFAGILILNCFELNWLVCVVVCCLPDLACFWIDCLDDLLLYWLFYIGVSAVCFFDGFVWCCCFGSACEFCDC